MSETRMKDKRNGSHIANDVVNNGQMTQQQQLLLPMVPTSNSALSMEMIWFYSSHLFHFVIYYYCIKSIVYNNDYSNIVSSLAFYGVYHRTPYNQVIHFFGVPLIIWTMMIYGTHLPFTNSKSFIIRIPPTWYNNSNLHNLSSLLPKVFIFPQQHRITWSTLWVIMYASFYIYMDIVGACLYTPVLYIMYVTSVRWTEQDQYDYSIQQQQVSVQTNKKTDKQGSTIIRHHFLGTGRLLWNAFLINAFSWYIQIHMGHHILEGATPASLVNLGAALTSAPLFAFYEGIWFIGCRQQFQQQVIQQVAIYTEQLCTAGANLRVCNANLSA